MKKFIAGLTIILTSTLSFAAKGEHEAERVKDAGVVMKEILNIPDNIPHDLLDKAECVIVLPSVKKGAFGIGGSYGRGVMTCRSGEHYQGAHAGRSWNSEPAVEFFDGRHCSYCAPSSLAKSLVIGFMV